jgi:kynureninase
LISAEELTPHYSAFRVSERLLLTGHSHQAWPDVAREGVIEAWDDAALHVDEKWGRAFEKAERVRDGFRMWLGEPDAEIALDQNTFGLVLRFLSALDLRRRPRLVTTSGEFHTLRRLMARLAEEELLDVVVVPARPAETLAERLAAETNERTVAVLVSAVLYEDSRIVPGLGDLASACETVGAQLLVDAYHALGCMPFPLAAQGLESAWVVGGGYKYLQLGEGNCFLRLPPQADELRPAFTGWFSEFAELAAEKTPGAVEYPKGGMRFAGATYDPTSHYRAAAIFDFFREQGLTPALLREVSQHQVGLLASAFDALDLDPKVVSRDRGAPLSEIGGFLALRCPAATSLAHRLHQRGVLADARGEILRLGPAPYLSDGQHRAAIALVGEVAREGMA